MDAFVEDFGVGGGRALAAGNVKSASTIILGRSVSVNSARSSTTSKSGSTSSTGTTTRLSLASGSQRKNGESSTSEHEFPLHAVIGIHRALLMSHLASKRRNSDRISVHFHLSSS